MTDASLPDARDLDDLLASCLLADRFRLRRQWQALAQAARAGTADPGRLAQWQARLAQSQAARAARLAALPRPRYDDSLPVAQKREEIRAAIAAHQVVIVAGETGSGKTTQLPKICLELGRGVDGWIGHTQPRRLAARAVATRLAAELDSAPGDLAGWKVRFTDETSPRTLVKLMTDGILLAEIQHDRFLERYDTLVIDEAHERSLNIDFLLGYLRRILPRRPDLKVIITSATIDHLRFARHFGDAPVIEVSGRTFPVETVYRPFAADSEARQLGLPQAIGQVLGEIVARERAQGAPAARDVLVFLAGEREIREVHHHLKKAAPRGTDILPLYARLGTAEQDRVFRPHAGRRVVLATNVAETSLTVPGIGYVIDPGFARLSRYSARSRIQRLPVEPVSRASADQRKGRCGRIAPGTCYRLYDEQDYLSRPEYTDPEILRTNLAAVILQMASLGLGTVEDFPFIDPPDRRYVTDGYRLLEELNALDAQGGLTPLGRQLARLPVDPRLGRILVEGARLGALTELLVIVAGLAVQDPRERPHDRQQAADEAHAQFADRESDFLWFLNCWNAVEAQRQALTAGELRRWCERQYLSFLRLREWRETHRQLRLLCAELGFSENTAPADYTAVHKALLSGLLSQVLVRDEGRDGYVGTRNRRYTLWPGSALAKKGLQWGVAGELLETQRAWARTVARVQPGWIEGQAQHLLRREYFDAQWDRARGMVMAREQVSLLGLVLSSTRQVHYGPLAPALSRELFIRAALVGDDWDCGLPFAVHNRALRAEVEAMEAKVRRRDLLVDDDVLYAWFDARVPSDVFSERKLAHWYREAARADRTLLCLSRGDLLQRLPAADTAERFPDALQAAGARLPLAYAFAPGAADDGATLEVPVAALNQLAPAQLDWAVPGQLEEKCVALARALPKELRTALVPVPDTVARAMPAVLAARDSGQPLTDVLAAELRRLSGRAIRAADFDLAQLPAHLRLNLRVVGDDGSVLGEGRELAPLRAQLSGAASRSLVARQGAGIERHGITGAAFPALPAQVETAQAGGLQLRAWPALVDEGEACGIRLYDDEATARLAHRRGLRRLFLLLAAPQLRQLRRALPALDAAVVHYRTLGTRDELYDDLWLAVMDLCFLRGEGEGDGHELRDGAAVQARFDGRRAGLHDCALRLSKAVAEALRLWRELEGRMAGLPPAHQHARADLRAWLDALFVPHVLAETPVEWLLEFPRYLRAAAARLDKLPGQVAKDAAWSQELAQWRRRCDEAAARLAAQGRGAVALVELRWMLEEYRVSLFAQALGTRVSVSPQRLEKQWQRVP